MFCMQTNKQTNTMYTEAHNHICAFSYIKHEQRLASADPASSFTRFIKTSAMKDNCNPNYQHSPQCGARSPLVCIPLYLHVSGINHPVLTLLLANASICVHRCHTFSPHHNMTVTLAQTHANMSCIYHFQNGSPTLPLESNVDATEKHNAFIQIYV